MFKFNLFFVVFVISVFSVQAKDSKKYINDPTFMYEVVDPTNVVEVIPYEEPVTEFKRSLEYESTSVNGQYSHHLIGFFKSFAEFSPSMTYGNVVTGMTNGENMYGDQQSTGETVFQVVMLFMPKIINFGGKAATKGVTKLVPLGLGSTGRTVARNLVEQMAMKNVMSNPTLGKVVMEGMKDSRWSGWSKMQYTYVTRRS